MLDEKTVFTTDAAFARFDTDADGIEEEDGETTIDWDEVNEVTVDNPPHANAFDSKRFYQLPATVARPIPQRYQFGEDSLTLKKPRAELKKAAWSLDNRPWTMGHPDTGMVSDVSDVKGFWNGTKYFEGTDDLDSKLHVPVGDEEAQSYIEDHTDVSVGFRNRIVRTDEYGGAVGGDGPDVGDNHENGSSTVGGQDSDEDSIDGYQTDMLFDHCASVGLGRCPAGKGCGIEQADAAGDGEQSHGHITALDGDSFISSVDNTDISDDSDTAILMQRTTDQPDGIHVADGTWFAVGPDEHPDESTEWPDDAKFRVDTCDDVRDAWNLRGTGDISIDESTLEARIKRVAEAKDCPDEFTPWTGDMDEAEKIHTATDSAKQYSICGSRKEIMDLNEQGCGGDCGSNDTDTDTPMEFDVDDLSVEAALHQVREQHDGVDERLDELEAATDAAEYAREAAEALDTDVEDLADAVEMVDEQNEKLRERIDELQRPKMEDAAETILQYTDKYGADAEEVIEHFDGDLETLEDKREFVEELAEGYDDVTAAPGDEGGSDESTEPERTGTYAKTPW